MAWLFGALYIERRGGGAVFVAATILAQGVYCPVKEYAGKALTDRQAKDWP